MYCFRSAIDSEKPLLHGIRNRDQRVNGFTHRDGCSLLELTPYFFSFLNHWNISQLGHQYCFLNKNQKLTSESRRHYWHICCAHLKENGKRVNLINVPYGTKFDSQQQLQQHLKSCTAKKELIKVCLLAKIQKKWPDVI